MPIYADHILYPTLTDECFHTEIHHVANDGDDKGVVYCEMQGRENDSGSRSCSPILSEAAEGVAPLNGCLRRGRL